MALDEVETRVRLSPCIATPEPLRHYVILRGDLPHGTACAMTVHAAGESALKPVPSGTYAVVLASRSPEELQDLEKRLIDAGIEHKAIREPDAPWHNALLAIGISPCDRSAVRRLVSSLPLYR